MKLRQLTSSRKYLNKRAAQHSVTPAIMDFEIYCAKFNDELDAFVFEKLFHTNVPS